MVEVERHTYFMSLIQIGSYATRTLS